jgi:sigma-E factor negative regulatory protein RseC
VIEAVGTVREVDGDVMLVEVRRRSACGTCDSQGGCGTAVLGRWFSRGTSRVQVRSALPLHAGEEVVVGLEETALLRASLLLYLLPVVAMIAGAVAGTTLGAARGDWPGIAGGLLGLLAGLAVSRSRAAALQRGNDGEVVLLRRHRERATVTLDPDPIRTTTTRST